jgi:hypothetical protein
MIELHAKNKYALIPPSIHPSGTPYRWERALPTLKDLPEAPDLRDLFHPGGTHHAQLLSMSSASAHAGKNAEAIFQELVAYRDAHLTDTLAHPDGELRKLGESAYEKFHKEGTTTQAVAGAGGTRGEDGKRGSSADRLIEIGTTEARLFHDSSNEAYAVVTVGNREETYRLRSTSFRRWLIKRFYAKENTAPGGEALKCALETLGAKAEFDGPTEEVYLRVADHGGDLWIDLGTTDWSAVRVTRSGWTVESRAPVHFVRGKTCLSFPVPKGGGSLRTLLPYLNAASVEDPHFVLAVAWIVGSFHPRGPYPILVLNGDHGTGKSMASRFIRKFTDPSDHPLRSTPKEERDLAVAAQGNRVVVFDNLSSLPDWLSDALCRLSTGGGFGTRQLYTDDEEVVFGGTRPILINGIPMVGDAADFRDRALPCAWPLLSSKQRERDLVKNFDRESPAIFGAVLDALVSALAHVDASPPSTEFRMADFAAWVMGAEPALPWSLGTFEKVYTTVQQGTTEEAIADSPVAQAIKKLVAEKGQWEGSATDLMSLLASFASPAVDPQKPPSWWPKSPKALSQTLRRLSPDLRRVGIGATKPERRIWTIGPYTPPPPRKGAGTCDTCDHATGSPRETGGRMECRKPFGGFSDATELTPSVASCPLQVASTPPQVSLATTPVDVASVATVATSRPLTASASPGPVAEESHLSDRPTLADQALANAKREGSLAPEPPSSNPYYYPPGGYKPGEAPATEIAVEGEPGVMIRAGEVFYNPTAPSGPPSDPPPPSTEERERWRAEWERDDGDPSALYPGGVLARRFADPSDNVLYRPPEGVWVVHEASWETAGSGATIIYSDGAVVRRSSGEVLGRFRVAGGSP